jgi:hypothetical protein
MNALAAEGFVVLGGPLGEGPEVLLIVDAPSEDAIRARLAADPWSPWPNGMEGGFLRGRDAVRSATP